MNSTIARMKSSGLLNEYRISFLVTVIVSAPDTRPFTSIKRNLPVPDGFFALGGGVDVF